MSTATLVPITGRTLMTSNEAVEHLAGKFKRMARKLWPSNVRDVQEDLVQEMNLACLRVSTPMQVRTFILLAMCRAIDYLDREERHGRLTLMDRNTLVKTSDRLQAKRPMAR